MFWGNRKFTGIRLVRLWIFESFRSVKSKLFFISIDTSLVKLTCQNVISKKNVSFLISRVMKKRFFPQNLNRSSCVIAYYVHALAKHEPVKNYNSVSESCKSNYFNITKPNSLSVSFSVQRTFSWVFLTLSYNRWVLNNCVKLKFLHLTFNRINRETITKKTLFRRWILQRLVLGDNKSITTSLYVTRRLFFSYQTVRFDGWESRRRMKIWNINNWKLLVATWWIDSWFDQVFDKRRIFNENPAGSIHEILLDFSMTRISIFWSQGEFRIISWNSASCENLSLVCGSDNWSELKCIRLIESSRVQRAKNVLSGSLGFFSYSHKCCDGVSVSRDGSAHKQFVCVCVIVAWLVTTPRMFGIDHSDGRKKEHECVCVRVNSSVFVLLCVSH